MVDLNGLTTLIYVDWIPQVNGPPEKSVRSDNRNQNCVPEALAVLHIIASLVDDNYVDTEGIQID
jgi:hypothetical protein